MTLSTESLEIETGHTLQQYTFRPDGPSVAGLILLHGQGDHLERYSNLAESVAKRGVLSTGVDLPGHGASSGRRGDIPSMEVILDLLDRSLAHLRSQLPDGAPIGLFCHSMGGMVGMMWIAKRPGFCQFLWVSSPLVEPRHGQHPLKAKLGRAAAWVVPWLLLDTGVRTRQLHHRLPTGKYRDEVMHHRISVRFAAELLKASDELRAAVQSWPYTGLQVLFTQGTEDPICPLRHSREIYDLVPGDQKRWISVEGSLHEPLHDSRSEWLLEKVDAWLDDIAVGRVVGA